MTATSSDIRLVCLDLGGVLVRICSGWEEACRVTKVAMPEVMKDPETVKQVTALSRLHETGQIDDATFDQRVADIVGLTPEQVGRAAEAWLVERYSGAVELVEWLAKHSTLKSACLSNTNSRHWRQMTESAQVGLPLRKLTWQFVSFRIGHMKPSPEIHRWVELESQLAPSQILFFDDNPANVEAARKCGWEAEVIDPSGDDSPEQVIRSLRRRGLA